MREWQHPVHAEDGRGQERRHHVVIIGSGFGGLSAARKLSRAPVEVTLISKTPAHVFQPLLYQVATGILSEGEVAPPIRSILHRQRNIRVLAGTVIDINVARRQVTSVTRGMATKTSYDSLIVAAGAETNYFGNDVFPRHALGVKSVKDALKVRSRIFEAFETAELQSEPADRARWLTFVIIGAGPTGVELAGQIAELSRRALRREFRTVDPSECRIVLLEAAPAILPAFARPLSRAAAMRLEHDGILVYTGAKVRDIDKGAVEFDLRPARGGTVRIRVAANTVIWSAGVTASPLAWLLSGQTGAPLARGGRIAVEPDLTLDGHPEIFVVGDMAALNDLPGVAQVAIQGGRYAADTIRRRLNVSARRKPFKYSGKGTFAAISRFYAIAEIGRIRLAGPVAWLLWLAVHLIYLVGFKNCVMTLFHWVVSFLSRQRFECVTLDGSSPAGRVAYLASDPPSPGIFSAN
jgi:NADH dehydrogenase